MSQTDLVIQALKKGPLTSADIIRIANTVNPTARLSEARRLVDIEDEWIESNGKRFKRYRIVNK